MDSQNRILIVGRQQDYLDSVTHLLESIGCVVVGTLSDVVAIDLAVSSKYDALLISDEVPQSDGGYITRQARNKWPSMPVVRIQTLESVLTQLRLAGVVL